jgi:hypothetical protein
MECWEVLSQSGESIFEVCAGGMLTKLSGMLVPDFSGVEVVEETGSCEERGGDLRTGAGDLFCLGGFFGLG